MPILYSFRRCPFAIRARMALVYCGIKTELREVKLSDMPDSMLQLSPKATIPVLALSDAQVVDESIDIMFWGLSQSDPEHWLDIDEASIQLIRRNDEEFKPLLDCYKYANRHPEFSPLEHRIRAQVYLSELNRLLSLHPYLSGNHCRLTDVAIFPFIRQFAGVGIVVDILSVAEIAISQAAGIGAVIGCRFNRIGIRNGRLAADK